MRGFFDVWWTCRTPCEEVWQIFTDTSRWGEWGPSVREVEANERYIRSGSTGRVKTSLGFSVPFEVTECVPLERWSWKVAGVAATGHRVEKQGQGCRVVFEVPLVAFPYAAVCLVAARRIARLAGNAGSEAVS